MTVDSFALGWHRPALAAQIEPEIKMRTARQLSSGYISSCLGPDSAAIQTEVADGVLPDGRHARTGLT